MQDAFLHKNSSDAAADGPDSPGPGMTRSRCKSRARNRSDTGSTALLNRPGYHWDTKRAKKVWVLTAGIAARVTATQLEPTEGDPQLPVAHPTFLMALHAQGMARR